MNEPKPGEDPRGFASVLAGASSVFATDVSDLELVHAVVGELLATGPPVTEPDPQKHVAEHFRHVYPALMADPRVKQAQSRIEERLESDAAADFPAGLASAAAALAATAAAGIYYYCVLADVTPAKGTSEAAHCT